MQKQSLLISDLIEFAERHHGDGEVVSRRVEGDIHRYTWSDVSRRARQVANTLDAAQLAFSDRVATLAWNGYRHLELYFGVSGSGRVLHTINPRLHPDQISWIANHAEDKVLCFDMTFMPIIQAIHTKCQTIGQWVAMCDADKLPTDSGIPNLISYEAWIGNQSTEYQWPSFDENSASSMCYTSGTTGNPKAALYSHRSTILHAYAAALPDVMCISARDAILPVVPMFHVNAWGIPYSAALTGAKLVFPGAGMDGKSIYELIEGESVTYAAGVPTVWQMLLTHMKANNLKFSTLNRTVIGGSACPPAMIQTFREDYGVEVLHAWGMTELSLAHAQVIKMIPPRTDEVSVWHQHDVEFQLVYVLEGWIMNEFDGHGPQVMRKGSCWLQPPNINHIVHDYSDDCEMLEIIIPADFKTIETNAGSPKKYLKPSKRVKNK